VNLYAESSAVLAWLLDEPTAPSIRQALTGAELVLAPDLTIPECQQALIHLVYLGQWREAEAADERARLSQTVTQLLKTAAGQRLPGNEPSSMRWHEHSVSCAAI
jgi:hypothetical protein